MAKALETIRKTPCKYGIIHAQQMCTRCLQEENTKLQADYERERIRADDLWDTAKAQAGEIKRLKELIMNTHDTLLTVKTQCECDHAKVFKLRQIFVQALKGKNDE